MKQQLLSILNKDGYTAALVFINTNNYTEGYDVALNHLKDSQFDKEFKEYYKELIEYHKYDKS